MSWTKAYRIDLLLDEDTGKWAFRLFKGNKDCHFQQDSLVAHSMNGVQRHLPTDPLAALHDAECFLAAMRQARMDDGVTDVDLADWGSGISFEDRMREIANNPEERERVINWLKSQPFMQD